MKIPFLSFNKINSEIKSEISESFNDFFDSKKYILGPKVEQFEREYALFNKTDYCVGISNGYDALFLALKALDIKKGDEVLVPSNTFIATVLAVIRCDAIPVLVEPSLKTYNIEAVQIEKMITKKTKAIIPVHLYGSPCNMTEIIIVSKRYKIPIIEDNAQAQGAMWGGQLTGSFGEINAVSFYPGKNLGALGDAGAVTTNSEKLYDAVMTLRNYGSKTKYNNELMGYNSRLDECQAGFLSIKLKHLDQWNLERRIIAKLYSDTLRGVGDLILPEEEEKAYSVYHIFNIRTNHRDSLRNHLNINQIQTLIHYPIPPHKQNCFQEFEFSEHSYPIAEELSRTSLSLPIWPGMSIDEVDFISSKIQLFFKNQTPKIN